MRQTDNCPRKDVGSFKGVEGTALEDGRTLHQGWSPLCEKTPAPTDEDWGVLKTTAIQAGAFLPEHNKHLPKHLAPRPQTEVKTGDILITCAGPRVRCGVACMVRHPRARLMIPCNT